MSDEKRERPSRWQACLSSVRRKLLRRRKVLLGVIWVARLLWRAYRAWLGDDPWTFYTIEAGTTNAT